MAKESIQAVIHHIRGLVVAQDTAGLGDSALLERFLTQRDEAAFEALVRRHGPMVLGVCRRILPDVNDAEDAFQATFLVFVRRAASITDRKLLGNWLYGVAYHTARAARSAASQRRAKEAKAVSRQQPPEENAWQELLPLLDDELSRLPAKYRSPVVLCDLEGKSRRDAAQELGLPEGTLSSRLARARSILARRLARRGVTLTAGAMAASLAHYATAAGLPCSLVLSTVRAGTLVLVGQAAAAGLISANVTSLSEGAMKTMFLCKLKSVTAVLLLGSSLVIGTAGVASRHVWAARVSPAQVARGEQHNQEGEGVRGGQASVTSSLDRNTAALIQEALRAAGTITEPSAKLRTLLSISSVQSKAGDFSGARKTQQEALEIAKRLANGSAKVLGIAEVALAQAGGGDRAAAIRTLEQAEQAAATISDAHEKGNAFITVLIYQTILADYDGALRTAAESGDWESTALMTFAGHVQVKKEDEPAFGRALKRALEMAKRAGSQRQTITAIAAAQAKIGDVNGALQLADQLGGYKVEALRDIAIAQAHAGDIEGALKTGTIIEWGQPKATFLGAVAVAQAKAGDRKAAQATLQEIRRIADTLQKQTLPREIGRSFRMASLARVREQLAMAQLRMGDLNAALQTAATIDSPYENAQVLLEIGTAQAAAGKKGDALETLRSAASAAEKIKPGTGSEGRGGPSGPSGLPESAKAATMRVIAEEQAKLRDVEGALRTVASIPTSCEKDTARAGIVNAQAEAGDVQGGLQTLAAIQDENDKAFAIGRLAKAQVQAGNERGALALVAQQTSALLKVHALLGIAEGRTKERATKE